MKYIITRTSNSDMYYENPKVEGVVLKEITVTEIDIRKFSSFEDFEKRSPFYREWIKKGYDFKEEKGYISKKNKNIIKVWVKEFSTLDELNNFINEVGEVVISYPQWVEKYPIIEIYDDFRE